jgi:two-component system alkaline phosphatase synthesis response regulator PhoP
MEKVAFVVEDEENIREIIKCALETSGLKVAGFEDAAAMFGAFKTAMPDLIILDIMLPQMDGLEALRKLKADRATALVPVILLTAKSAETDKVAGLDLGAEDYITKPFGVLELMARVRAVLRRSADSAKVYEARDLKIDTERHEVSLYGQKIELTLKEFELLKLLMENAGKVVTRDTLLDKVWGYAYAGETRTLDMHIRSLRQKLGEEAGGNGFILTVRGVGYKFNL